MGALKDLGVEKACCMANEYIAMFVSHILITYPMLCSIVSPVHFVPHRAGNCRNVEAMIKLAVAYLYCEGG